MHTLEGFHLSKVEWQAAVCVRVHACLCVCVAQLSGHGPLSFTTESQCAEWDHAWLPLSLSWDQTTLLGSSVCPLTPIWLSSPPLPCFLHPFLGKLLARKLDPVWILQKCTLPSLFPWGKHRFLRDCIGENKATTVLCSPIQPVQICDYFKEGRLQDGSIRTGPWSLRYTSFWTNSVSTISCPHWIPDLFCSSTRKTHTR